MRAAVTTRPAEKHLVLVGGGHAHVTVLRDLALRPEPGLVVTLVTREIDAPYSGMLPGYVAGHYDYDACHIDVIRLAAWADVRFIHGTVTGIDRAHRRVLIEGRAPLTYDLLSIDVGIVPDVDDIEGAAMHALAVKPVSTFSGKWKALERAALAADGPRSFAVVGSGAAGFELILAIRFRMETLAAAHGLDASAFNYTLVGARLLPSHNSRARRLARRALERQHVQLIEGERVTAIGAGHLDFASGKQIAADATLLTTNAKPSAWFARSGLPLDPKGFLAVRPTLQLLDDDDVFAVGDCSTVLEHPREKAGVFAVRQGPPLTANLRRRAQGAAAEPFVPQRSFLTILSTGGHDAIAARNGLAVSGPWVWRWKDRIDRRFMAMFNAFADMGGAASTADAAAMDEMRCAGCAAKIGPVTLARALERVTGDARIERDDAATIPEAGGAVRLETIDFFRAFWPDPYVFGEIAAAHALSDIYAMGGKPHHALANIVLPFAAPSRVEEDLVQLLAGARAAFDQQGVALVGGHSSEGAEMAAGFFVSGLASTERVLHKAGLRIGDKLILTRPIGAGILFAALMRHRARGFAINAALSTMRETNAASSAILAAAGATAATDVTGFGLAGHLLEMLDASGLAARVELASVPLYPTVLVLAREGIASSLLAENARLASRLGGNAAADHAALAVLFDPQTSGGLLAGLPPEAADRVLQDLHAAGIADARIVGEVVAREAAAADLRLVGALAATAADR